MARIIRSQAEDAARIQAEEQKAKEQEEKARVRLNQLSEELGKMEEGLQQLSKSKKEAEQDLKKVYEEEQRLLECLNTEKEKKLKKQSELKQICAEGQKIQIKLMRLIAERTKLQNEIRSAKGVAIPPIKRKIRSANQNDVEIESIPIFSDSTYLFIPENSLFTKVNVGDYVSYVGEGDENTTTWRVWEKTDYNVVITPVLDSSCRKLRLSSLEDYLDIVKNAGTQTDKINKACKEWYVNSTLGITAENIRSMTVEDINEACGYTPSEISTRHAYYPPGKYVVGTITYNGNTYTKKEHPLSSFGSAKFYTYDGGGVERTDSNGYKYRAAEENNPVYVSKTYYEYCPSNYAHVDNKSVSIGEMLGSDKGLLASPCVSYICGYASFKVRQSCRNVTDGLTLTYSDGDRNFWSKGVRPLISLSSTFQAVGGDGTENAPWEIRKI